MEHIPADVDLDIAHERLPSPNRCRAIVVYLGDWRSHQGVPGIQPIMAHQREQHLKPEDDP